MKKMRWVAFVCLAGMLPAGSLFAEINLPGTWQKPSGGYDGVYDAADGNLPATCTPAFISTYATYGGGVGEAMIAGGTILSMTNSATTGPYYRMSTSTGQGTATGDMTFDIRMKLSDVGTTNNYQFALAIYRPATASQVSNGINRVQYFWRLGSDSASYGKLGTDWLDLRILIDADTQTPTLYLNGSSTPATLTGANTYGFLTSAATGNYIQFGDMGSSGGLGSVELKYIAWSNDEKASVVLPSSASGLLFVLKTSDYGEGVLSRRPVPDFNVMVNDDGDWSFRMSDPESARRSILAAVDGLAGTPVKAYARCVGMGSDVLYYPTQVASVLGWRDGTGGWSNYVEQARAGIAAGVDPVRLSGERCNELGIYFFPTVRMNDPHFLSEDPFTDFRTGEFWMEHHGEFTLDSPPDWLDFRHQEVREYRLNTIFEVIDRYEDLMDGIELDFVRHPFLYPKTSGMEYSGLSTEMIAQVREKLDEAAGRQGRPFYLIVRVNPTLETCHYSAMDIESWVWNGDVDVIVPAALYDLDYDMDITSFQSFTEPKGVKIYPAIYQRTPRQSHVQPFVRQPGVADYETSPGWKPSIELVRGTIANLRHMGADGFEMYNFRTPAGPLGFLTRRACSCPAALTLLDRVFGIPPGPLTMQYEPAKQIPVDIQSGETKILTLYVGQNFLDLDDLAPAYIGLRIGLREIGAAPQLTITVNGEIIHAGDTQANLTWVTAPAHDIDSALPEPDAYIQFEITDSSIFQEGANLIQIERAAGDGSTVMEISQLHLGVLYDNPFGTLE